MTREEYKDKHGWWMGHVENGIVDIIYDDFESRVCENCKFKDHVGSFSGTYLICKNKDVFNISGAIEISSDFGCNKFKRKTDED